MVSAPAKDWWDAGQPKYASSDLGRVFSQTFDLRNNPVKKIYKPLIIRVGNDLDGGPRATVVFDTELLSMVTAIPDRFAMFNTYRNGLGGSGNWMGPPYLFTGDAGPGWAHQMNFKDPRDTKRGPLPRTWAKYQGNYRFGERIVIAYTVGETKVLESPWLETAGDQKIVTRHLEVGPHPEALLLKVFKVGGGTEADAPAGSAAVHKDGQSHAAATTGPGRFMDGPDGLALHLPPSDRTQRFKLSIWSGSVDNEKAFFDHVIANPSVDPVGTWTKGGPAQWPEILTSKGTVGSNDKAFTVDTIHPPFDNPYNALFFFGGHDFFDNGDAAVCTIHGDVWRVSGLDEKLENVSWKRYATGMFQPLGLRVVDNTVYVLGRDQITRLHDLNGDNEADFYENFNNDMQIGAHVHEYATGLDTDPEGNFYYVKGVNGNQSKHAGVHIKVSKDGKDFEVFATGYRWPNGSGVGPDGTVTMADQQGNWVPSSRLDIIRKGGFYGHIPAHHRDVKPETYDGPLCWIPHKVDNSCGGQTWIPHDNWGLGKGRMLHLSYGKCQLLSVLQERVGDIDQGGVVVFPFKFTSGAMRPRFSPKDGHLYISGLKGWQTSGVKDGCFERVRYTGRTFVMPVGLNVHRNGIKITFNRKLDRELAE
ncbi:MAG: DUF6797 domain-containing protein, partial [Verrucomicrobiota bacterium]